MRTSGGEEISDTGPAARSRPVGASSLPGPRLRPPAPLCSRAIVVVDSVASTPLDASASPLPEGWNWTFANTSLPSLFERLLADAKLAWSALILAQPHSTAQPVLELPLRLRPDLISLGGPWRIPSHLIPQGQLGGQTLFVILNGHQFPLCDLNQAIRLHRHARCDATVFELRDPGSYPYDEQLILDYDGQVHRVARIYAATPDGSLECERSWPAIMILSADAVTRLAEYPLPTRLNLWPGAMLRAGLRLRGQTLPGRCFDLHASHHWPRLGEALVQTRSHWLTDSGQLIEQANRVWVSPTATVHPEAQLIGPLFIGDQADVGARSVIVGPATIGRGARIPPGTYLRRCFLPPDAAATSQSEQVLSPADTPSVPRSIRLRGVLHPNASAPLHGLRLQAYRFAKRAIDIAVATLFLTVTLPLYAIIALAIKVNSPGPVFYGHVRQGLGGRRFNCWKFRTMVPEADEIKANLFSCNEVDGPQFKMKQDPRIFRVGRILRRFNIDEWPQFFNVLCGEMSLVGPRPSPEPENQMCPAWREARLSVRPGITGLWQVCRRREEDTDFQEWIYYDVQYVKQQSLWLDFKILLQTLRVAFKGR